MKIPSDSTLALLLAAVVLFGISCWGVNFYKLTKCDFEAPYSCEVIHGVGIFPPLQLVTVWFGTDND